MIDRFYEPFEDRNSALEKLLDIMPPSAFAQETLILALSDGGVFLASQIAKAKGLRMDCLFTQSIFSPKNPECEIAIVSESMDIIVNDELTNAFGISRDFIYGEAQRKYEEKILPDIYRLRKGESLPNLAKKSVLLIDDAVESGMKMSVAMKSCAKKGAEIIAIAAPVINAEVAEMLEESADALYCVYRPRHFVSADYYYKKREAVDSAVITEILESAFKQNHSTKEK